MRDNSGRMICRPRCRREPARQRHESGEYVLMRAHGQRKCAGIGAPSNKELVESKIPAEGRRADGREGTGTGELLTDGVDTCRTHTDGRAARDDLHATTRNKSWGPPSRLELDGHAKNPVHRGSYGRTGRVVAIGVACVRGRARLAKGVQGKGGAHLLVDDADQVLDAVSFQGVS